MAAAGKPLMIEEIEMLLEAVKQRQRNFPEEPIDITWVLVLGRIGMRFTSVICEGEEWVGQVKDLKGEAVCPNGHVVYKSGVELTIGWVAKPSDPQPKGNNGDQTGDQDRAAREESRGEEADTEVVDPLG